MLEYRCAECGKTFQRPTRARGDKQFCSAAHSFRHRRKARNSPEGREKSAKHARAVLAMMNERKRQIAQGREDRPDYNVM